MPVKALLQTHAPVLAAGFLKVLEGEADVQAGVVMGSFGELCREIEEKNPTVLVVEGAPEFDFGFLTEVRRAYPSIPIVLWVQEIVIEIAHQAKTLGVRGILRKDLPNELLVRCLRKVSEGEMWFERTLLSSLLQVREVGLSPRERQLLKLVSQGLSNKQVAATLSIAEGTVKVYFSKLFRKVGVNDRFELALYGLRNLGMGREATNGHGAETTPRSLVVRQTSARL